MGLGKVERKGGVSQAAPKKPSKAQVWGICPVLTVTHSASVSLSDTRMAESNKLVPIPPLWQCLLPIPPVFSLLTSSVFCAS